MKKFLPIIGLIFIILAAFFLFLPKNTTADMHQASSDLSVDAITLYADFRADETVANEKYLNKTLIVKGEVMDVIKSSNGLPKLKLFSNGTTFGVSCVMDKESEHQRQEFHKGEQVQLKCICMDYYNDVALTNCVEVR